MCEFLLCNFLCIKNNIFMRNNILNDFKTTDFDSFLLKE